MIAQRIGICLVKFGLLIVFGSMVYAESQAPGVKVSEIAQGIVGAGFFTAVVSLGKYDRRVIGG